MVLLQAELQREEARVAALQQQLLYAEGRLGSKQEELSGLQKQLEGLQQELEKTSARLAEREAKVCCRVNTHTAAYTVLPEIANVFLPACLSVCAPPAAAACRCMRCRRWCDRARATPARCKTTTPACRLTCR